MPQTLGKKMAKKVFLPLFKAIASAKIQAGQEIYAMWRSCLFCIFFREHPTKKTYFLAKKEINIV